MPDKPKLTLETALAEFPKECRTVLESQGWGWYEGKPGSLDDDPVPVEDDNLLGAIVLWLAGKECSFALMAYGMEDWPGDPFRWRLEEVRAQLNKEKEG